MFKTHHHWILIISVAMIAHAQSRITFSGLPGSGVAFYPGSTEEFKTRVGARVEAASLRVIEPILPYCALLVNESSSPLIAVVVRMDWQNASGKSVSSDMMYSSMTTDNLIPPGATILMTPISGLNTELPSGRAMSLDDSYGLIQSVAERSATLAQPNSIAVTLDSVTFGDGSVEGPDRTNNVDRMNSWRSAEYAVAKELLKRDSASVSGYLSGLKEIISEELKQTTVDEPTEFRKHQRRSATAYQLLSQHFVTKDAFNAAVSARMVHIIPQLYRRDK